MAFQGVLRQHLSPERGGMHGDEAIGRGTGAAVNAMAAGKDIKLVAMGDMFEDRLKGSMNELKNKHGVKVDVPDDRQFLGFDAFEKVLEEELADSKGLGGAFDKIYNVMSFFKGKKEEKN